MEQNFLDIFIRNLGSIESFDFDDLYGNANRSSTIGVIAPFDPTLTLEIAFTYANGRDSVTYPLSLLGIGTRTVDGELWNEWSILIGSNVTNSFNAKRGSILTVSVFVVEIETNNDTFAFKGQFLTESALNTALPNDGNRFIGEYVGIGTGKIRTSLDCWAWSGSAWVDQFKDVGTFETDNGLIIDRVSAPTGQVQISIQPSVTPEGQSAVELTATDITNQRLAKEEASTQNWNNKIGVNGELVVPRDLKSTFEFATDLDPDNDVLYLQGENPRKIRLSAITQQADQNKGDFATFADLLVEEPQGILTPSENAGFFAYITDDIGGGNVGNEITLENEKMTYDTNPSSLTFNTWFATATRKGVDRDEFENLEDDVEALEDKTQNQTAIPNETTFVGTIIADTINAGNLEFDDIISAGDITMEAGKDIFSPDLLAGTGTDGVILNVIANDTRSKDNETDITNINNSIGSANGITPLNASTQIDRVFLPDGIKILKGTFGSGGSTTGGDLPSSGNITGDTYICDTDDFISTEAGLTFDTGDYALFDITNDWVKVDHTENVSSVNGKTGIVVINKTDVGLGNVDNTSDANKPVSIAQQTALDLKEDTTNKTDDVLGNSTDSIPYVSSKGVFDYGNDEFVRLRESSRYILTTQTPATAQFITISNDFTLYDKRIVRLFLDVTLETVNATVQISIDNGTTFKEAVDAERNPINLAEPSVIGTLFVIVFDIALDKWILINTDQDFFAATGVGWVPGINVKGNFDFNQIQQSQLDAIILAISTGSFNASQTTSIAVPGVVIPSVQTEVARILKTATTDNTVLDVDGSFNIVLKDTNLGGYSFNSAFQVQNVNISSPRTAQFTLRQNGNIIDQFDRTIVKQGINDFSQPASMAALTTNDIITVEMEDLDASGDLLLNKLDITTTALFSSSSAGTPSTTQVTTLFDPVNETPLGNKITQKEANIEATTKSNEQDGRLDLLENPVPSYSSLIDNFESVHQFPVGTLDSAMKYNAKGLTVVQLVLDGDASSLTNWSSNGTFGSLALVSDFIEYTFATVGTNVNFMEQTLTGYVPSVDYLVTMEVDSDHDCNVNIGLADGTDLSTSSILASVTAGSGENISIIKTGGSHADNKLIIGVRSAAGFGFVSTDKIRFKNIKVVQLPTGITTLNEANALIGNTYFEGIQNSTIDNKTVGKNYFPINGYENQQIAFATGIKTPSSIIMSRVENIKIRANTQYTIKINNINVNGKVLRFDDYAFYSNGVFVSGVNTSSVNEITFTSPIDANEFNYNVAYTDFSDILPGEIEEADIQLEFGATPTTYEPYKENNQTLSTELASIGTVFDTLDNIDSNEDFLNLPTLTQRIGIDFNDVLQSATSWTTGNATLTNTHRILKSKASLGLDFIGIGSSTKPNMICKIGSTLYTVVTPDDSFNNDDFDTVTIDPADNLIFRVDKTTFPNTGSWETFLQANDVTFQFELETPIVTELELDELWAFEDGTFYQQGQLLLDYDYSVAQNTKAIIDNLNKTVRQQDDFIANIEQDFVTLDTEQTITGLKNFNNNVTTIAPIEDLHVSTKKYVDDGDGLFIIDTDVSTSISLSSLENGDYSLQAIRKAGTINDQTFQMGSGYDSIEMRMNGDTFTTKTDLDIGISNTTNANTYTTNNLIIRENGHTVITNLFGVTSPSATDNHICYGSKSTSTLETFPAGYIIRIRRTS